MPASRTVPTPKAVLGDDAGAEGKLPYSTQVYEDMRLLATSTPLLREPDLSRATRGSYFMVFNTILNFDSLDAGRTLDPR